MVTNGFKWVVFLFLNQFTAVNDDLEDTRSSRVDAEKVFPVVAMDVGMNLDQLQHARELGFNAVHWYGLGVRPGQDIAREAAKAIRYCHLADSAGLSVALELDAQRWFGVEEGPLSVANYTRLVLQDPVAMKVIRYFYLADEPNMWKNSSVAELRKFYGAVKAVKDLPAIATINWAKNWYDYVKPSTGALDIAASTNYSVQKAMVPDPSLGVAIDFFRRFQTKSWLCLQIFNRESFSQGVRYPTKEELRYLIFAAHTSGMQGIMAYSYTRARDRKISSFDPNFLEEQLEPALTEFKELVLDVQGRSKNSIAVPGDSDWKDIEVVEYVSDRWRYIVIINDSYQTGRDLDVAELPELKGSWQERDADGEWQPSAWASQGQVKMNSWEVKVLRQMAENR